MLFTECHGCHVAGISPGLVRLSIGITGKLENRCEQLLEAYEACTSALSGEVPRFPYRAAQVSVALHAFLLWYCVAVFFRSRCGEDAPVYFWCRPVL
jgi:hypothetical protein